MPSDVMLSVAYAESHNLVHYAECCGASPALDKLARSIIFKFVFK